MSRALSVSIAAALCFAVAPLAAQEAPPSAESPQAAPLPPSKFVVPFYLRGVDLNLPAQSAFKDWPPKDLEERLYWLPWTGLTFQRASLFNQPVFLFVSVPWNRFGQRIMKEALADPVALRVLNHDYISVAVRADRHPDIFARYGTGNWPAISLLLPDGAPMLSQANPKGLALPISIGFVDSKTLLFNLNEGRKYFEKWQNVLSGVSQIYEHRVDLEDVKPGPVDPKANEDLVRWILGNADQKNGGFGIAPKYAIECLAEWAAVRSDRAQPALLAIGKNTLGKMIASPLYDGIDGGFHRMAAAPDWGSIQYEKMLSANTDLMREMTFALRTAEAPGLREALAGTARFVTTVLARPGGGFYHAQSADPTSLDGGAYWTTSPRDPAHAPQVDKLVLAGPNALAGAALLRTGAILGDPALERAGRGALDLVLTRSVKPGRGADHVVEPDPDAGRFLVTQADVAFGFEDAYEATGDARYLDAAKGIVAFVRNNMKTGTETSYRDHVPTGGAEFGLMDMPFRPMADNTRIARVLVRLEALGEIQDGRDTARAILGNYAGDLASHGARAIESGLAIDELLNDPLVITIEGADGDPAAAALRRSALDVPHGWVVIRTRKGGPAGAELSWRGATRRVDDPAALPNEVKALASSVVGAP
ncbi:MAG TPA: DUF255 domain-containing protein [Candidatus Polarisedimenticolaceae bacterium]|nr:DUF255 domain-containing protein [Candidatus Polarisedimenticolaceae bacterium]